MHSVPLWGHSRSESDFNERERVLTRSDSYIKLETIYRAMCDLEMDILIIVIHMFLSFSTSAYDGSKFFAVSER